MLYSYGIYFRFLCFRLQQQHSLINDVQKPPRVLCDIGSRLFTCLGFRQDICKKYLTEHPQALIMQLDDLTLDYDQIGHSLTEQM